MLFASHIFKKDIPPKCTQVPYSLQISSPRCCRSPMSQYPNLQVVEEFLRTQQIIIYWFHKLISFSSVR